MDASSEAHLAALPSPPLGLGRRRRAGLLLRRGIRRRRRRRGSSGKAAEGEARQGGGRRRWWWGGEVPGGRVRGGARRRQGLPPEAPRVRGPLQVPPRRRRRPGAPLLPAVQPVSSPESRLLFLFLSLYIAKKKKINGSTQLQARACLPSPRLLSAKRFPSLLWFFELQLQFTV